MALCAQGYTADFKSDITEGCSPIVVNFQDLSSGNPKLWKWDFGNGATSTKKDPSTTYFDPGTYTVTLTVFNEDETDSSKVVKTAYITVYEQPQADFTSDKQTGCSPQFIQFSDASIAPAGTNIVSWKWEFGDGASSTEKNPRYNYKIPGSYTVTLTITNDKGCSKLITKPNFITITPGVVPKFTFIDPQVCMAPALYNFTSTSTGPGNLSYSWNLGNGTTATTQTASGTYATNGSYTISLVVTSDQGCTDSISNSIDVGKAVTDFTIPAVICPKTTVDFLNNSTPRPIRSVWEFSNGYKDTTRNTATSFPAPGTYTVTLINVYGVCTDTLSKDITVGEGPVLSFTASDTFRCQPPFGVNFSNATNGTSYQWDFGDGSTSTDANPSHTYSGFGEFDVTLIANSGNGCTDTLRKPKYIKIIKPIITIPGLPAGGCIPYPFTFKAEANNDEIVSYQWNFGDGNSSNQANPSHTYTTEGTYNVTLTVTTKTGCTETITIDKAVKVGTKPIADFSGLPLEACASEKVQFTNLTPKPNDEWTWLFGDGGSSREENPLYEFTDTGKLDVTLIAYNNGCGDTITKKQYINIKPPISKFTYKPNCNNLYQYTFTDASIGARSWTWKIDNRTYVGKTPPAHTFPAYGTYTVSLTTTNDQCSHSTTMTIVISDQTPDFTANNREGCKPFAPILTAKAPNPGLIENYTWDFGNGQLINGGDDPSRRFTYETAGNYYVKLITTDTFGCKHEVLKSTYIRVNGPDADFTSTNNTGCKGLNAIFSDTTKTDGINKIVKWEWDFGDGT
ncbi:MAG TPA: PKD domain-containing protein, partial [Flavisolibacter sp.]|nr:PKD domain-containing protein [Flavisolibacter sp.]